MKKLNVIAFLIIALGLLTLIILTAFFNFYTFSEDGSIYGEWRDNETMMYLGTAKNIANITGLVIVLCLLALLINNRKTLKKQDVFGGLFAALGALTIIGSITVFYPCTNMMPNLRPMICFWTMKVLSGIFGAVSITGLLMLVCNKTVDFIKGLNVAVILLTCISLLILTNLPGLFCLRMTCVDLYRPFVTAMSFFFIILSLLGFLLLNKKAVKYGE